MNKKEKRQEIGRRIAHLRAACGFTQRQLAAKCNLEQSHIARIERGKFSVGLDTLTAIAEALGKEVKID